MAKETFATLMSAKLVPSRAAIAANNVAVCCFYQGDVREAVALLEKGVDESPAAYAQESLVSTLVACYDIGYHDSLERKAQLFLQLAPHIADSFNLEVFKLPL